MKTAPKKAYFINGGWVLNQDEPSFVTMALVIERKKLALEALKQRRATERLEMTSKTQLYVFQFFCYYSPGDRAPKNSPGGPKTKKSF